MQETSLRATNKGHNLITPFCYKQVLNTGMDLKSSREGAFITSIQDPRSLRLF